MKISVLLEGNLKTLNKKADFLEKDGWKRRGKIRKPWVDCYEDPYRAEHIKDYLYLVMDKAYS